MARPLNRREFIALAGGCAGAAALGTLQGCSTIPRYNGTIVGDHIKVALSEFRLLAQDGGVLLVDADFLGDQIALIEVAPNDFRALSAICTHQGCAVKPSPAQIRCPCHGSTYDIDGNVIRGPAVEPLQRYDVELSNEVITIKLPPKEGDKR